MKNYVRVKTILRTNGYFLDYLLFKISLTKRGKHTDLILNTEHKLFTGKGPDARRSSKKKVIDALFVRMIKEELLVTSCSLMKMEKFLP